MSGIGWVVNLITLHESVVSGQLSVVSGQWSVIAISFPSSRASHTPHVPFPLVRGLKTSC
ncbi:hypothetical protein [Atlanticothrix silvestris]|uniref:hypothetical protein n=1 Tax=Atlanticothrix silvestris TaxID=2840444 RepID=UPI001BDD9586|nr:hypothetical protein [Atlanticothrix silvestris]